MVTVSSTPVELIDDNTAQQYYNDLDTLEGAERESRAEALRLWADQKDADQKREQFDTLNKIYTDFDSYVNDAGLQDFDEESRYRTANRQFIASQFDDTVENQQTIYPSFRDKWTESVAGKKGLSEKETFGLIKQGIDARNEVSQAADEIPGDIALALFDSLDGGDPVDVPKLIDTWKTKNAEAIKKLPKGWETPLLEAAQKYHTETDAMLRDYAEPLKQVYDHFAAVTGRDTEGAGESNPKNQEEMDSMVDTLASMPKPVRERAYASVVLGAKKAGQDPKTFMENWGESWSRTLNMVRTGALTAQEMAAESEARQLEDKQNPPDYYISKSTGEKIPLANRAFHDEADLRKVTPEEIAADAAKARQKVKRFEVVRELQSVADNEFDPIEKINKGGFLGFMESMAYGTPQSLAYTGTALIPFVGPYLAGTAIFADEYNQLREQGMSVDQAVQVGSVSAGIQAGLERTGAELIFGKLPVFEKLMRRIANPARVGKAGSAGIRFFSAALGENITEGAQDLTTPLVQDVAEALGADVPDVQWQPILEKWSGSRLDVLAATIPTILLGTGVATFGDNKRFAQFEERQDIYRSMGMDDATIKEIEDGKDISEKQQKFQTAFSKLTPENVKAGVAYMEEKIASAQGQQQDPNTPTLTRATLADGTTQFIVRDEQGRIAYRTAEEQSAQIAMRELLRNQITGSTRGIVESLQFIDQVNQAAGRGEDVQKLLIDGAPRTLLDDYEANPTEQNLDNLFATVRAFGQDISEPAELANFPVLASNQGALAEGIFKSVIRIQEGATGVEVMRDFSQDNLKRAIAENRVTMDWVREQLNQVIPLIESDRLEGRSLRTETDTDVIESFSDVAVAYMNGRIRDEQVPAGFRGFLRRMAIVVKDIFRRAYRLKRAIADGKVDANFETFLAESVGLNQQTLTDTVRDRAKTDIITNGGQMLMDFSIGSRASAVSNDTPALRAGNATIVSPTNFSIGAYHGTPHKVDKFSTEKIGTGEGAQAYGWGLYFAEELNVAQQYKDVLSTNQKYKDIGITPSPRVKTYLENAISQKFRIQFLKDDLERIQEDLQTHEVEAIDSFIKYVEANGYPVNAGNLYTVDLDVEPEDLLDWDKPLREQSPKVQAALAEMNPDYRPDSDEYDANEQGQMVYTRITSDQARYGGVNPEKMASVTLNDFGIKGIRYLDGGSRSEGQGTYNYVVFDENLIKITGENGQPVTMQDAQAVSTDTGATNYSIGSDMVVENGRAYSPTVRDLLQRRAAGENISRSVIDQAIRDNFPAQLVEPPKSESDLPSRATIDDAINEGQRRDQIDKSNIQPGDAVTIRQDVPAMTRKGVGVVTIKSKSGNSYDAAARISDPQFILNEKKSLEIGMGGAKGPHIAIRGKWASDQSMPSDLSEWTQVGFNPDRHSFYYDRATMKQVVGGSEAYQIGNTVFVKNAKFGDGQISNISYSIRSVEHFKNDTRFDKLVKDGRVIIGHDIEEFKGMHILLHSPDNAFAGTIKLTDGNEIQGKGGVYYPALFADKNYFWASTEAMVMRTAKHLNEIGEKNGGKILMGLVSAPVEKLFSSTSMATGVVKFLNALTSETKGGLSKAKLNSMLVTASKVKFAPPGKPAKTFKTTLQAGDGLDKNLANIDKLLEPTGSIFQVRKLFVESLAEQLAKHLNTKPKNAAYVAGILADAENKYAKTAIKRGKLSKASIMQGLGNLLTEPFLRDFQDHGNGKIYAVLEVDGKVDGIATTEHDSYPATIVPKNKKAKVKVHVLNQAVDWQDVVGKDTGEYTTPEERMFLMPTSGMSATTLKVLGTKAGSVANPISYSIASQSEIDRVNRALGGMNRGPDERLKVYERAREKFSLLQAWNRDELQAMQETGADDTTIRRSQILQGLGELDAILSILPPEVRGRVGGYTKLASIAPMDVFKDGVKISEVSGMKGALISAWRDQGLNIGQAGKKVDFPPGYEAKENLATARADRAIADFFRDRIKKIDAEFEKVVAREYRSAILDLVKKSRPKAGDNNVRKSTLGAETQKLADMVQRATLMDEDAVAERMLQLEQTMATSENSADMVEEWGILNQFGDLKNRNSETLAQAYGWFKDQLQMGREAWRIKEEARIAENRERAKKTVEFIGGATAVDRFKDKTFMDRVSDWANSALLDHASFEQFVTAVLPPDVAADFSTRLRKADVAAQKAEIDQREGILNALRQGAKAAGTTTSKAMVMLKTEVPDAVRYLDDRKVKNTKLTIEQAEKIVRGEIDRGDLTDTDVRNLSDELAALPADTRKENITLKQVTFRGNEVRLPMTRGKAIQLLLSWNQPDVQDKMRREGWNEDSIADLRELTSDPVSQAMISHAQELYGKGAGIVNPVYARMFGMNMPQVKNYAPTRFLHSNDVKDIGLDGSPVATGTTPGFAKSRVTHSAKIASEDALSVMQQHILMQSHWVNFAELAREYRSLINNPEVREAIKAKHGSGVLKTAEQWADQMEQRGGNQAREAKWVSDLVGSAIGGQSVASLGFNLKTLAMQLDNSVRFALALDTKQIISAMSSPDQLIEDIKTVFESDALQVRLKGGATAVTKYMFQRYGGRPGTAAKITEASMSTINWMDTATTSLSAAIVYRANLNEALEAGMPEALARETALDAAAAAIYRFAQPVSFGQKSNVENTNNIYGKAFFLFMSDPRLKAAIMADAIRGLVTGQGDKGAHIRRIIAIEAMALLSHFVASSFRDAFSDDEDEDIWSYGGWARAFLLAPVQGFFFLGTFSDLVLSHLLDAGWFTPTQNPLISIGQQGIRALKNADDILAFDDPDALLKEWNAIARTMAVAPAAAMPAVLLNAVKPIFGAASNAANEE